MGVDVLGVGSFGTTDTQELGLVGCLRVFEWCRQALILLGLTATADFLKTFLFFLHAQT